MGIVLLSCENVSNEDFFIQRNGLFEDLSLYLLINNDKTICTIPMVFYSGCESLCYDLPNFKVPCIM